MIQKDLNIHTHIYVYNSYMCIIYVCILCIFYIYMYERMHKQKQKGESKCGKMVIISSDSRKYMHVFIVLSLQLFRSFEVFQNKIVVGGMKCRSDTHGEKPK